MTIRKTPVKSRAGKGWLALLIIQGLGAIFMLLVMVWSGIERTDTTYFINIAMTEVREREALFAKLEVERERLLSPHELRKKAREFGMHEPFPDQVRRMESR